MARKYELTWQAGSSKRAGRWKKFFRGKYYYFDGGRGKSDREAYARALEAWRELKAKLVENSPKPYQVEYQDAIQQWTAVLRWCDENGDPVQAEKARSKIKDLKSRLAKPRPKPLLPDDDFFDQFELPVIPNLGELLGLPSPPTDLSKPGVFDPAKYAEELDGSPQRILKELWKDRLSHYLLPRVEPAKTIEGNISRFLEGKQAQIAAKELSVGRFNALETHLGDFSDFAVGHKPVSAIDGELLSHYRIELLRRVGNSEMTHVYAKNRLDAAKQFIRWLWKLEIIEHLPRILDSKELRITSEVAEVKLLTVEQIQKLYGAASDRTKLYICLALNCGMTQVDITDLKQSEVNWKEGTLTRKRSKTRKHKRVPKVQYLLWDETYRLLKQEREQNGESVLLNENGQPLRVESLREDGKLSKTDNVRNAFSRLCRKLKLNGLTFKALKKTSATLFRDNLAYQGLEDLFLGHAPQRMSEKHYTGGVYIIPHEALQWLADQYKLPGKNASSVTLSSAE